MRLKTIIKNVNRRYQHRKTLYHDANNTLLSKSECRSTFFAFTRKLKELGLTKYSFPVKHYGASLFDVEETVDYTFLRLLFGDNWWESIDIYNKRGFVDEEGPFGSKWGIQNRLTYEKQEFDTFEELKKYFSENYTRFGFVKIV